MLFIIIVSEDYFYFYNYWAPYILYTHIYINNLLFQEIIIFLKFTIFYFILCHSYIYYSHLYIVINLLYFNIKIYETRNTSKNILYQTTNYFKKKNHLFC